MEVIDISRDTKNTAGRRRMEQRRRAKRKAARRRALKKLFCRAVLAVALVGLVFFTGRFLIKNGLEKAGVHQSDVTERDFSLEESDIEKPVAIDSEETLGIRLAQLVAEHPECAVLTEQREQYPTDLLKAVCNNTEMIEFALGYPAAQSGGDQADVAQAGEDQTTVVQAGAAQLTAEEKQEEFPLFLQWDERWGYHSYGGSVIGLSGCGPTCLSMVVTGLTGRTDVTPDVVADFAMENGYYIEGTGTMWSLMEEGCGEYGITGRKITANEELILSQLEEGNPIICSVGPGYFTAAGHFIVLVGTKDGKIIVNDPNSRRKSEVLWSYESIASQIKSLWVYQKNA